MIKTFFCHTGAIDEKDMPVYRDLLPGFMQQDITRYQYVSDQRSRLIARMMLYDCLDEDKRTTLTVDWHRNEYQKPFIRGWYPFSISHSGDLVAFAYGDMAIGLDIEREDPLDYLELMNYFHPDEQHFIAGAADIKQSFYTIWTKKEALLKAVGTGLVNDLGTFNCLGDSIDCRGRCWYFREVVLYPGYSSCLCTPDKEGEIDVVQFFPGEFLKKEVTG